MVDKLGTAGEKDLYRQGFLSVYIDIIERCNLACLYCYAEEPSRGKRRDDPSLRDLCRIVQKIETTQNLPSLFYEVSGGEPLIRPDWEEVFKLFLRTGREVYINSNAVLIDEDVAHKLGGLYRDYDKRLFFNSSFDSHLPEVHEKTRKNYELVLRNLRLLRKEGIRIRINVVLTRYNLGSIEDTMRFISENITDEISMGVARPTFPINDKNKDIFVPYEQALDAQERVTSLARELGLKFYASLHEDGLPYCEAGVNHLLVMVDGTVTPCYCLRQKKHILGNMHRDSFGHILNQLNNFNRGRDRRVLLCEHLEDVFGEPPLRLERLR